MKASNKKSQLKNPPIKEFKDEKKKRNEKRTKLNKKALLIALVAHHGIITYACADVGIARKTFYEYYKTDKEFKIEVDDIDEVVLDLSERQLITNVKEGKEASIFFHLKCKGKKRGYIEKHSVEMEHKGLPQKMVIGGQSIDFS